MWLKTMTEEEIEQIAEAFAHYRYAAGEEGMFYLCPDEEAVKVYLRAFVRAGLKAGWMHTAGEGREGYIMISGARSRPC